MLKLRNFYECLLPKLRKSLYLENDYNRPDREITYPRIVSRTP